MSRVPHIERPPETYNYLDKFTLTKGDKVKVTSKSYYLDSEGNKQKTGISGVYTFLCAVKDGILVAEPETSGAIFVYLGKSRKLELTGTQLEPHILSLPVGKKKKVKK